MDCQVEIQGRVWESVAEQTRGDKDSGRYFNYSRLFRMPGPPSTGMTIKIEPTRGTWVRVSVRTVEWEVCQERYVCQLHDLLLEQLTCKDMHAEAAAFVGLGFGVGTDSLDASDEARERAQEQRQQQRQGRQQEAAARQREAEQRPRLTANQEQFEKTMLDFSQLSPEAKRQFRRRAEERRDV